MLAENSDYCLKPETKYQAPGELAGTQTGLSIIPSASSGQNSVSKTCESHKQPTTGFWRTGRS